MNNTTGLISDEVVLQARRLIRENPELHNRKVAEQFDVPMISLEKAVRGATYKHLNNIEPPIIRSIKKEDQRAKAIELYKKGLSYNAIKDELNVAKSSLSLWLRDIPKPEKPKPEVISEPQIDKRITTKKEAPVKPRKPEIGVPAEAPYVGYKLYKYIEKDGVCRVQLSKPGSKQVLSFGRYLMAVHLGRPINENERVIHRDGKEDVLDNLLLLTKEEYKTYRAEKRRRPCIICESEFIPRRTEVKTCSRKCTRAYQLEQMGLARLEVVHNCTECKKDFHSSSNKPLVCSDKCRNDRKYRLLKEKQPPKIPKPHKVKSKTLYQKEHYHNQCEICEQKFFTPVKNRDICYNKKCREVVNNYGG